MTKDVILYCTFVVIYGIVISAFNVWIYHKMQKKYNELEKIGAKLDNMEKANDRAVESMNQIYSQLKQLLEESEDGEPE